MTTCGDAVGHGPWANDGEGGAHHPLGLSHCNNWRFAFWRQLPSAEIAMISMGYRLWPVISAHIASSATLEFGGIAGSARHWNKSIGGSLIGHKAAPPRRAFRAL
jgi:hypothetical protein